MNGSIDLGFPAGSVLVVTGGGSGIGRAVALGAARMNVRVAVWDLVSPAAESTTAEVTAAGGEAVAIVADSTDAAEVSDAMERTSNQWERAPQFLVCNGGPPASARFEIPEGVALLTACVSIPSAAFVAADPGEGAAIVNVASIAGNFVASGATWYAAGKAAIAGLTRALAVRYAPAIRVNAVAPGVTRTPRTEAFLEGGAERDLAERCPLGRPGTAEEVAAAILFLCSPLASYITGTVIPVDGGLILHQ